MIGQAQGILSKSMGAATTPISTIKALAGSHPVAFGVVLGISAYYAINKYWLNPEEETAGAVNESVENTTDTATT